VKVLAAIACLSAIALAALPELKVNTENGKAISSTSANRQGAGNCQSTNTFVHKYVPMSLTLTDPNNSRNNISVSSNKDSIRGRGNSTWNVDKKPYRIKFDDNKSMFGSAKHRSWALLANWYDPTFTLNAVGFELGKRLELPGTPGYYFVDLYLNNAYKGIYQMTDLVQVNKGRVEVDEKEGWLAEFDYHCPSDADEIDFNTNQPNNPSKARLHTFIKSPEGLPNQSDYQFVKDQINAFTDAMFKQNFPENGYRDLVDLESYAKYIMIQQFMDNFDFVNKTDNTMLASSYAHKDKDKKIIAGPIWDLDLAAGVEMSNFPKHYQTYQNAIKPKHPFYEKFFSDPVFLAKFKKAWDKHKSDFQAMTGVMDSIANIVQGSVEKNFALQNGGGAPCTSPWGCGGGGFGGMTPNAPATVQAYKDEVGQLKTWWNNRINFFQQELNKMNIDISKDIVESSSSSSDVSSSSSSKPSSSSSRASSSSNRSSSSSGTTPILISQTPANSLGAKIEVFNLQGKLVYSGHSENSQILQIPVQTKGIYIVRYEKTQRLMVVK